MTPPKLSDLYNQRRVAKIWFVSMIGGAVVTALVASPLFTTRTAWGDPIVWVQFLVGAAANIFLVLKAVTTEDYREMKPIDPRLIPRGEEPKP